MPNHHVCSRCGAKLPANSPLGACPRCLLTLGLESDASGELVSAAGAGRGAAVGGKAAFLPSRSAAVQSPASGVLLNLAETMGHVPCVLLRDGPGEEMRPVRPGSDEMPNVAGGAGRYQLLGEIARGGIGAVLKGRDVDLGRDLAVKVLLEKHRDNPEMVRRFVEEAQIGGQLQHPGIVPVYEIGQFSDRRLYIAMKLVKGRTLAALLHARRSPADDRSRFLSIFEQVCQTMAYAHARGVIHRDLKPSNVMVGNFGEVQVMDWGLAKVLDQGGAVDDEQSSHSREDTSAIRTMRSGTDAGESRAGSVVGTPAYMAPEQARGELATVDERADVFGLGSILCEMLTGQPAYLGKSEVDLCRWAEHGDLAETFARLDACGADAELIALARSCLAASPADRPRDAGMVCASLSAYLSGVQQRLRAPELAEAEANARVAEERKRRLLTLGLTMSMVVIAVLGAGGWAWIANERAVRRQVADREFETAYDEALMLRAQARSAPADDASKWIEAAESAKRAKAIAARGEGAAELRDRAESLLTTVIHEQRNEKARLEDRRMVERLAEIHADFAVHLDRAKTEAEYAAAFRDYGIDLDSLDTEEAGRLIAARPTAVELAGALDQWASFRRGPSPDISGARSLVAIAKTADPDPWRNRLRDALSDRKRAPEVLKELAASAEVEKLSTASVTRLASALSWSGDRDLAITLLRGAQRAHPDDFWINSDLAHQLARTGQFDDAARYYSAAVAIRPRSAFAVRSLANALRDAGRLEDAAAMFRESLRLKPDDAHARVDLGTVLMSLGKRDEALAEFVQAKRLEPDNGMVRMAIADSLAGSGQWNEAIQELRDAVAHEPQLRRRRGHHWPKWMLLDKLGVLLFKTGQVDDAVAALREAIELAPDFAPAHNNLGRALLAKDELSAALESFRRAHYLSASDKRWHHPFDDMVEDVERRIALDARLPAVLRGDDTPADADERAEFARLCASKRLFAASARLWSEAFTERPDLADDLKAGNRFAAACSAAMAGCGHGRDEPLPDETARRQWREQARQWLEADLAAYRTLVESGTPAERALPPKQLGLWRVVPELADLRNPGAIGQLSDAERQVWRELWARANQLYDLSSVTPHVMPATMHTPPGPPLGRAGPLGQRPPQGARKRER